VAVAVNPPPTITVPTPSPICSGSGTTLAATGGTAYTWTPSTGLSATTGSSVTANPIISSTYTITGTDGNGCINTTTVAVAVNPLPTITVPTPAPICSGSSATLTATGGTTYTWTPSTGLSATTGSSVTAIPTISSTYTITGTDGNGCINTTTVAVAVNPLPTITSPTPASMCSGSSATLTSTGGTTYTWTPSTGLSATTGSSVTANPTISSTYTITGTNSSGCVNTTTVPVTVNPPPTITAPTPSPICSGSSITLTATGGATYTWTPSTGLSATTGSSVTANPTTTTTYTITGTNSNGCVNTTTVAVAVNPPPTITSPTPSPICTGTSTLLTVNGGVSYTWTPSTGLSATTGSSVTANPTISSTYTITGTDGNGCVNTTTVMVVVNPNPNISVETSGPICSGSSTTITALGAVNYTWAPSIGLNNTTGSSVTADPTLTTTYLVNGIDSNGCSTTILAVVAVNTLPTIIVTPPTPICNGSNIPLIANGAVQYSWVPSTGLSNTSGSSVLASPSSSITYTITGTDINGCQSTTQVDVDIFSNPIITLNTPPPFCVGGSATLIVEGAKAYSWGPSTGLSTTTGDSVLATPSITTTYTVTGVDSNGCIGKSTISVIVNPKPKVSANVPPIICFGKSANLHATGAVSYKWTPSTSLNNSSGSSVTASPTVTTTYSVIGINNEGCSDTANINLQVQTLPVVSIFGLSPMYCINSSPITLTANPPGGTFSGSGVTGNQFDPDSAGGNGTYLIKYIYTDSLGCVGASSTNVTVATLPNLYIAPTNPTVCSGMPVTLSVSGGTTYTWSPGTGLSDSTSSSVNASPTTTTTYVITGTNVEGCSDTTMVTVNVDSMPKALFSNEPPNYCDPLTLEFNNASTPGYNYDWNFGDGSTSTEYNPQHTYNNGGTYQVQLVVTSPHGCTDIYTKEIIVKSSDNEYVKIADAFTPNGDGVNDVIAANVLCPDLTNFVFRIYNRWGQLLFQTYNPDEGWDGRFKGQMQLVGVYDYYIEFNCGDCKLFKKGNITLLK